MVTAVDAVARPPDGASGRRPVVDFSAQCVACQIFRAFEENPQLVIQLIAINGFPAEAVPR